MPPRWFMIAVRVAHQILIALFLLAVVSAAAYAVGAIGWLISIAP